MQLFWKPEILPLYNQTAHSTGCQFRISTVGLARDACLEVWRCVSSQTTAISVGVQVCSILSASAAYRPLQPGDSAGRQPSAGQQAEWEQCQHSAGERLRILRLSGYPTRSMSSSNNSLVKQGAGAGHFSGPDVSHCRTGTGLSILHS